MRKKSCSGSESESFIYTARISLESGRAIGLLFKKLLTVFLDYQQQAIVFAQVTQFQPLDSRRIRLVYGHPYRLRVVAKAQFFEVYLDGDLVLNFVRYQPARGRFGLYIEAGRGTFSDVRAVDLKLD